ncbi:uncharacterized protein LOC119987929 [Tripterygium wilfordii]|uniref:uncharacterized protein LOC119987929 n=1 Tax=Tripterygium wilfordii TaxID=458696 RepID=UPI0018F830F6|nr:uncharacterized protein LOC119987929 [Tripterygium wilfordii]
MEDLEARWSKLKVTDEEKQGISVDQEDMPFSKDSTRRGVFGKVVMDRFIATEVVARNMMNVWKTSAPLKFHDLGKNIFAIIFHSEHDKRRVMEGRPWLFDRSLLVLKEMESEVPIKDLQFDTEWFWVQLHNLPLAGMSRALGEKIGGTIGDVVEVDADPEGLCWGRYLRVRICLSLLKPLTRGKMIHFPTRDVLVNFKYERLPKFCFSCGCMIHSKGGCPNPKSSCLHSTSENMQYDSWLRAEPNFKKSGQKSQGQTSDDREQSEYGQYDSDEGSMGSGEVNRRKEAVLEFQPIEHVKDGLEEISSSKEDSSNQPKGVMTLSNTVEGNRSNGEEDAQKSMNHMQITMGAQVTKPQEGTKVAPADLKGITEVGEGKKGDGVGDEDISKGVGKGIHKWKRRARMDITIEAPNERQNMGKVGDKRFHEKEGRKEGSQLGDVKDC